MDEFINFMSWKMQTAKTNPKYPLLIYSEPGYTQMPALPYLTAFQAYNLQLEVSNWNK